MQADDQSTSTTGAASPVEVLKGSPSIFKELEAFTHSKRAKRPQAPRKQFLNRQRNPSLVNTILDGLLAQPRRKVFVSYHHGGDQGYYDLFSRHFGDRLELIRDNSLERRVNSEDVTYIMRRIREHHLHGSSCTIVLCGRETPKRKYVDWEIHASLAQSMGLVGVMLPTIEWFPNGGTAKPLRLQDNIDSEYAQWVEWNAITQNPQALISAIELANASATSRILNSRQRMMRNA